MTAPATSRGWHVLGDLSLAGVSAASLLATAALVEASREPLAPVTERWIREVLAGVAPELVLRVARTFVVAEGVKWPAVVVLVVLLLAVFVFRRLRMVRVGGLAVAGLAIGCGAFGSSLYDFVLHPRAAPFVAVGVLLLLARAGRGARRLSGAVLLVGALVVAAATSVFHRVHASSLLDERTLSTAEPAYDVVVAGDPARLVFTDQRRAVVVHQPYVVGPHREETFAEGQYPERLIPSADPRVVFLATSGFGARRVELTSPPSVTTLLAEGGERVAALAEDVSNRRLLILNEWNGTAVDVGSSAERPPRAWVFSHRLWPVPWLTVAPTSRRAYLTNMLGDGSMKLLELDSLQVLVSKEGVHAYQSVIDGQRGLLWATRALPGELVGFDLGTLEPRIRIPLAPAPRDVVLDEASAQLFVNTYPAGELFRVDAVTGRVLEEGACGWRCRSLFIDVSGRTLWTASLAGVRRFALDKPLVGPR